MTASSVFQSLRPAQWSKNLLVFAPLASAHELASTDKLASGLAVFIAFSLTASSLYLLNDLSDMKRDKIHPRKKLRPIPSGDLSPKFALLLAVLLFGISLILGGKIAPILGFYFTLGLSYTLFFKKFFLIDTLLLTSFYLTRIAAGGVATDIYVSAWLYGFSAPLFFSLACLKRYTELGLVSSKLPGRGYGPEHKPALKNAGLTSILLSSLVLAFYALSPEASKLYATPLVLLAIPPALLGWSQRLWRAKNSDDPVLLVLKEPRTYILAIFVLIVAWVAVTIG